MTDDELRDWIDACDKMEVFVKPAKARRSRKAAGSEARAELNDREAR